MTSPTRIYLAVAGCLALVSIFGWQQQRVSRRQTVEIADLVRRTTAERIEVQRLRAESDDLAASESEPTAAPLPAFSTGDTAFDAQMESTLARVRAIQNWLKDHPAERIPEFRFLQDTEWIEAASDETRFDVRTAARDLRFRAKANLAMLLHAALKSFGEAHPGQLPKDLSELGPFLVAPISPAILQRYEMRASGSIEAVPRDLPIVSERAESILSASEKPFVLFPVGSSGIESFPRSPFLYAPERAPEMAIALSKANQAYRLAHKGAYPSEAAHLLPYFEDPRLAADFAEDRLAEDTIRAAIDEGLRGHASAHGGRKPANREDILPYVSNPSARAILAAKDSYLRERGEHPPDSAALRPYVKDAAARTLLEDLIRAEGRQGQR